MEKSIQLEHITLGTCYYPEHWPKELWASDLERMKESGIEVIRIAEFAWNLMEPQEGQFTFDFFDEFLELCLEKEMKVIMGTPTATPPAWAVHKYPDILNADRQGIPFEHGLRRHYTYNSPNMIRLTKILVEKMAGHYANHPAIIGWQIDNELNCETQEFCSESDQIAFRAYLQEKYGTLENLNEKLGTVFWNQTYTDWEEIRLPGYYPAPGYNPHMKLEEKRFVSMSARRYCALQAEILRKHLPEGIWVTTNGVMGVLDNHAMTQESLDFLTHDNYPNFAYDVYNKGADLKREGLMDRGNSWQLATIRSISPNFGIMEQQSGGGGWVNRMKQPMPKPGQMRLWTYQAIGHGADYVSYFRWRTCWQGTEIYWHGLLNYDNLPNRRITELKQIHGEIQKLKLAGEKYKARIALFRDYTNEWDGSLDIWRSHDRFSEMGWNAASQYLHEPMDLVYNTESLTVEDLKKYDLLIVPHASILTESMVALWRAYAEQGGTVVFGCRTGYKDEYGRCPMRSTPGLAAELAGVKVVDFTPLVKNLDTVTVQWDDKVLPAPEFNEILEADAGTQVLGCYSGNYYDGMPALTCRKVGKGAVYYWGAAWNEETAAGFLKKLGLGECAAEDLELPKEVELCRRGRYMMLLNYAPQEVEIRVRKPMNNTLTGEKVSGEQKIAAYDVMILE